MTKHMEQEITNKLCDLKVPYTKARQKAKNTVRGVYCMVVGALALVAGIGIIVLPIVVLEKAPSVWVIAFGALSLVLGFYLGLLGANAFSGEVSEAETVEAGNRFIVSIGRAIGLARGKVKE